FLHSRTQEFVALERRGDRRVRIVADYLAHATQTHVGARTRRLRKRDHILNRLAYFDGDRGCKKYAGRTDIPGLTCRMVRGSVMHQLKRKLEIEPLMFSLLEHGYIDCKSVHHLRSRG